ncbi:hypothetical protein [Flavobacterium sp.]|uniref:hypothetical protein n=1 Tax=Flavobacterium sp. TaxID=239 RepID=UPI003750AED4
MEKENFRLLTGNLKNKIMKRIFLFITISFLLYSCSTSFKVKKKDLLFIDSNLKESFNNNSYQIDSTKHKSYLLNLFEIRKANIDTVNIKFDKNGSLILSYKFILGGNESRYIKGRFKKNYYEIYLRKDKINIPLIYSKINIDRIRVYLKKDSTLVVDKYYDNSGNIFLLAAGGSSRRQYFFKKIK